MGTEPKKNVVDVGIVPAISAEGDQSAVLVDTAQLAQLNTLMKVSTKLFESGMFPGLKNPGQYLAVVLAGNERGYAPMTSLTNIHIINGRFGYSAQMIGAELRKAGVTYDVLETDTNHCKIRFQRKGQQDLVYEWTTDDATRAKKLPAKPDSVWTTYPQDMLFSRCLTAGGKKFAPDALMGCNLIDEIKGLNSDQPEFTNDPDKSATENLADKVKAQAGNSDPPEEDDKPADTQPPPAEPPTETTTDDLKELIKKDITVLQKEANELFLAVFADDEPAGSAFLKECLADKVIRSTTWAENTKGELAQVIVKLRKRQAGGKQTRVDF